MPTMGTIRNYGLYFILFKFTFIDKLFRMLKVYIKLENKKWCDFMYYMNRSNYLSCGKVRNNALLHTSHFCESMLFENVDG